jgi:hypothetical protein
MHMIQTMNYDEFVDYLAIAFFNDYGINFYSDTLTLPSVYDNQDHSVTT